MRWREEVARGSERDAAALGEGRGRAREPEGRRSRRCGLPHTPSSDLCHQPHPPLQRAPRIRTRQIGSHHSPLDTLHVGCVGFLFRRRECAPGALMHVAGEAQLLQKLRHGAGPSSIHFYGQGGTLPRGFRDDGCVTMPICPGHAFYLEGY